MMVDDNDRPMTTVHEIRQRHPDYLELIQFTDTHIFADEQALFDEVNTLQSLQSVIEFAKQTDWPPDAILLTGDLVHQPEEAAYRRLGGILATFEIPVYCLPGNHDTPELIYRHLVSGKIYMEKCFITPDWAIIMLDTWQAGNHSGRMDREELETLEQLLHQYRDRHCLLCLHHHPVSINCPWMDSMSLENPQDFFNIVDQFKQVRGILWGHIHQEFDRDRNQVKLMSTPSTCVQFKPRSESYTKDTVSAGYRVLRLCPDGSIMSRIKRIKNN